MAQSRRGFEYLMPTMTSRILAVSLSDWPVLRASSDAYDDDYCREAAAQLSAPASTRHLLPILHLTSIYAISTAQQLPRTLSLAILEPSRIMRLLQIQQRWRFQPDRVL